VAGLESDLRLLESKQGSEEGDGGLVGLVVHGRSAKTKLEPSLVEADGCVLLGARLNPTAHFPAAFSSLVCVVRASGASVRRLHSACFK
jgi:hypothetical protein